MKQKFLRTTIPLCRQCGEPFKAKFTRQVICSAECNIFYRSKPNKTGCWIWQGKPNAHGYGNFTMGNLDTVAHRASFKTFVGAVQKGKMVCHECNVRMCVNPSHLYAGTHSDNMQDAIRAGTLKPPTLFGKDHHGYKHGLYAVPRSRRA